MLERMEVIFTPSHLMMPFSSYGTLSLFRRFYMSFVLPHAFYHQSWPDTAPCFLSAKLARFDESLRHLLCVILNVQSLHDDSALLQASLPVRSGGIGIRRSVQLAPSAYLASAAGCSELIPQILPPSAYHLRSSCG